MGLSFLTLRRINVSRTVDTLNHPLHTWSLLEWAGAMAGECGEACNVAKKLIRYRSQHDHLNRGVSKDELLEKLADEIADTVIYADLLAAAAGIDLGQAVAKKFNKDSVERNCAQRLPTD